MERIRKQNAECTGGVPIPGTVQKTPRKCLDVALRLWAGWCWAEGLPGPKGLLQPSGFHRGVKENHGSRHKAQPGVFQVNSQPLELPEAAP